MSPMCRGAYVAGVQASAFRKCQEHGVVTEKIGAKKKCSRKANPRSVIARGCRIREDRPVLRQPSGLRRRQLAVAARHGPDKLLRREPRGGAGSARLACSDSAQLPYRTRPTEAALRRECGFPPAACLRLGRGDANAGPSDAGSAQLAGGNPAPLPSRAS